jgi:predicted nuclease with TOPRIM domain
MENCDICKTEIEVKYICSKCVKGNIQNRKENIQKLKEKLETIEKNLQERIQEKNEKIKKKVEMEMKNINIEKLKKEKEKLSSEKEKQQSENKKKKEELEERKIKYQEATKILGNNSPKNIIVSNPEKIDKIINQLEVTRQKACIAILKFFLNIKKIVMLLYQVFNINKKTRKHAHHTI